MSVDDLSSQLPRVSVSETLARASIEAAISLVPIVGSALATSFQAAASFASEREMNKWLAQLSQKVDATATRLDRSLEQIFSDPEFTAAVVRGSRAAAATANNEKRDLLARAVCNSGSWSSTPEFIREHLLGVVIELRPEHIECLAMLAFPSRALEELHLKREDDLSYALRQTVFKDTPDWEQRYDIVCRDLYRLNLINTMPGSGFTFETVNTPLQDPVTTLGGQVLQFVENARFQTL